MGLILVSLAAVITMLLVVCGIVHRIINIPLYIFLNNISIEFILYLIIILQINRKLQISQLIFLEEVIIYIIVFNSTID